MDGVVEIITVRERRHHAKLRMVAETHEPGVRVRAVVARHGVRESLLFTRWRQVREGVLAANDIRVPAPPAALPEATAPVTDNPPPPAASLLQRPTPEASWSVTHGGERTQFTDVSVQSDPKAGTPQPDRCHPHGDG